jgi:hypothetical protein
MAGVQFGGVRRESKGEMSIDDLIEAHDRHVAEARRPALMHADYASLERKALAHDILQDLRTIDPDFGKPARMNWTRVLLNTSPPDWARRLTLSLDDLWPQPCAVKVRTCPECYASRGHWGWCVGQGYSAVGPHPDSTDASPSTQRAPARGPCPCGIERSDCDYHRPTASAVSEYRIADSEVVEVTVTGNTTIHGRNARVRWT